jgi:hypothetical protein
MKRSLRAAPALIAFAWAVAAAGPGRATLIDFESIPGGAPSDGLAIGTQFLATAGVSFSLEGGGLPLLAQVGNPTSAFAPADTPDDGARHGSFFLNDDGNPFDSLEIAPLRVTYSVAAASVSGDLIDVDFDEAIRIEARDANDQILEVVVICNQNASASCTTLGGETGSFTTGDGVTTSWSIARAQADIRSLRIVGERNNSGGFGLAFDNFDTGVVPEPGASLLLACAAALLAHPPRPR